MLKIIIAVLIAFALIVGARYFSSTTSDGESNNGKRFENALISPRDFKEKLDSGGYVVLDIRTREEYETERIAENETQIDFYGSNFKEQLATLDPTKKYLLYCRSGNRSSEAARMIRSQNLFEFYELKGGINAWIGNGFKIVRGK